MEIRSQCGRVPKAIRPDTGGEKMAENLNRQRVLNFLEAFYSGNIDGALARCGDDVDFVTHAPIDILPHLGHRHGKAELAAMWRTIHARYSDMRHEMAFIVSEDDRVATSIRVFFRKRANGRIVQFDVAAFYTLRDGSIVKIQEILDSFELVQQVLERDIAAELIGNKSRAG
jgi:ketosteroid isomerase-like protein